MLTTQAKINGYTYSYFVNENDCAIIAITKNLKEDDALTRMAIEDPHKLPCAIFPKPYGRFVVPSKISGHKVCKIGDMAFNHCGDVTEIILPESVVEIGPYAFLMCTNTVDIKIPDAVTNIYNNSFCRMDKLKRLLLPRKLRNLRGLGSYFAWACQSLEHIRVSADINMDDINSKMFAELPNLKSIWIEDGVTKLPRAMFLGCRKLTKVRLPCTIKEIEPKCFMECSTLCHIDIPNGIQSIGELSFAGCSNLLEIAIPTSVDYLAASAFSGTPILSNTRSDGLAILGSWALGWHGDIPREVVLPYKQNQGATLKFADGFLATSTSPLNIIVEKTSQTMNESYLFEQFQNADTMTSLIIEYPATSWGGVYNPLRGCKALRTIILPDSLTNMPYQAFADCTNLVSVRLPQDWVGNAGEILRLFKKNSKQKTSRAELNAILKKMNNGSHGKSLAETIFYMGCIWGWEDLDIDLFNFYLSNIKDFIDRHPNCYDKTIECPLKAITLVLRSMIYGRHKYKDRMHDVCIWSMCKLLADAYDEPVACQWLINHDLERGDMVKRVDFYKRMARHEARMVVLWSDNQDSDKKNEARDKMLEFIQKIIDLGFAQQAQTLQIELETMMQKGIHAQQAMLRKAVTGTGWIITENIIATCAHVIAGAQKIYVEDAERGKIEASIVTKDNINDIAILKLGSQISGSSQLPLRIKGIKIGERVFTIGYPLSSLLGQTPKFSEGSISALSGAGGDNRYYQINVPLQPGNSGGALVDEDGKVIALISSGLDSLRTAAKTGVIPQNVNYAIKIRYLTALLDDANIEYGKPTDMLNREDAIKKVTKATVLVIAE